MKTILLVLIFVIAIPSLVLALLARMHFRSTRKIKLRIECERLVQKIRWSLPHDYDLIIEHLEKNVAILNALDEEYTIRSFISAEDLQCLRKQSAKNAAKMLHRRMNGDNSRDLDGLLRLALNKHLEVAGLTVEDLELLAVKEPKTERIRFTS